RETFVVWERASGKPVHRAIVWQCRRSSEICARLHEREREVAERTGLIVDPYFSGTKLKWLLDENPALRARGARAELCFGTIDTWLIYRLSRGSAFLTDYTNASRTMLMNLRSREWDASMLDMLGVPREMLPAPVSSRGVLAEAAAGTITSRAVPIGAVIGDQQSALFGQGGVNKGDSKSTYGTGAFLLAHTGDEMVASRNRLVTTSALGADGQPAYALEGSVFVAGAAIQWLRDGLRLIKRAARSQALARRSRDRTQPYLVPAFVGLGAPHWDPDARGAILGITRGTTREDLVRAALDSIAYQVTDVIDAMRSDTGRALTELRADGGAAENDYLMQFQADLLGCPVRRAKMAEATALGAAMLAGLAVGVWRGPDDLAALRKDGRVFRPRMVAEERTRLLSGWRDAVARVKSPASSRA
ncbi:MAG: FGGY family carbohydrate kinase, partial [Candidatus Binataceae bacterium]